MHVSQEETRPDQHDLADFYGIEADMLWDVATVEYVAGFVQGAADVWDEVANAI